MPKRPYNFRLRKKAPKKGRKPRLSFDRKVLSVINKQREMKTAVMEIVSQPVNSDINMASSNVQGIMPPIPVGDGTMMREGNQITLKKLVISGYYSMEFPIADNLYTRVLIRHMILKQKNSSAYNVTSAVTPFLDQNILEPSAPYAGNISDWNTPINRNAFTVRRDIKRIVSCPQQRSSSNQNTGNINKSYTFVRYTITFGEGKKLNYRNSGSNYSTDFPYFLAHSSSPLGENSYIDGVSPVEFYATASAYYYDS